MSIELVMPYNRLILCCPLLLLPSIFPSITVLSNQSALCIRWPNYWSFSFSICPSNEYSELISFRIDWFDLAVQRTLKRLLQHHSLKASILWCLAFFMAQLSHPYMTTGKTIVVIVLVTQSCPTLCDPTDCSPPGSSVYGILQARILQWIAIPFSRGSSQSRDRTQVSCVAGRFFTVWATGKTRKTIPLTIWTFVSKVISLLFNMLSRFIIAFLPRNKCLLISWLQSPSTVILEP